MQYQPDAPQWPWGQGDRLRNFVKVFRAELFIGGVFIIIKGVNPRGLKHNVHCSGISGATVENVHDQVTLYDMQNFSTVIISVGGNNASNGSNIEYVEEKYDQLFQYIKKANSAVNIILCTASPRKNCLVTELNDIKSLSEEHRTKLVDMENYFCDDGNPVFRYYRKDKIHLSKSGNAPAVGFHRKVSWLCNFGRELRSMCL